MADAGRILIMPKGTYDASVSYEMLDLVFHNDISWLAKKPVIGIEPSDANSEHWARMTGDAVWRTELDNILNGTTAVGNALKLNGLTAEEFVSNENLILYPHDSTTKTSNGITWTDNGDGTITANGTATATSRYYCNQDITIKAGTYTLSGCPKGGGASVYEVNIWDGSKVYARDIGNGETVTLETDIVTDISLAIRNGITVENLVFKPMLNYGAVACAWRPYHVGGAKDADTVDGYHASDLAKSEQFSSQGNFTWMQSKDGNLAYRLQLHNGEVQYWESTDGGANWAKKATLNKNYLPLDGSVPMSGTKLMILGGKSLLRSDENSFGFYTFPTTSTSNDYDKEGATGLVIYAKNYADSTSMPIGERIKFKINNQNYTALHTGNSQKVVTSASAPSDTSALWVVPKS